MIDVGWLRKRKSFIGVPMSRVGISGTVCFAWLHQKGRFQKVCTVVLDDLHDGILSCTALL